MRILLMPLNRPTAQNVLRHASMASPNSERVLIGGRDDVLPIKPRSQPCRFSCAEGTKKHGELLLSSRPGEIRGVVVDEFVHLHSESAAYLALKERASQTRVPALLLQQGGSN